MEGSKFSHQNTPEELATQKIEEIAKQQASLARMRAQGMREEVLPPQEPLLRNDPLPPKKKVKNFGHIGLGLNKHDRDED